MKKTFLVSVTIAIIASLIALCTSPTAPKSSAKAITEFSITNLATGVIDTVEKTIQILVPEGTNVTALVAHFTTTGTSVSVGTTIQESGITQTDYTAPVLFTVKAEDNSTAQYTVTVTIANKAIMAFSFTTPAVTGVIDQTAKTINLVVPEETNPAALVAQFSIIGARVHVGTTEQVSGSTENNFSTPVGYIVTALDGTTKQYTVTVTVATKSITAFSFTAPPVTGVINETSKTINVIVPEGTSLTALTANFITNGVNVSVNDTVQVSGTSVNDYSSTVVYKVIGIDDSVKLYAVTVLVATKAITAFSIVSPAVTGVIDETAKTIKLILPEGTDTSTGLAAQFTTNGASVSVDTTIQESGTTTNIYSNPLVFTVKAIDSTTAQYRVSVKIATKSITSFSFISPALTGVINDSAKTITVTLIDSATDLTAIKAKFTTNGIDVKVGTATQVSDSTPNDFTKPVVYAVTGLDLTVKKYTIIVKNPYAKEITAFSFANIVAYETYIDKSALTISVRLRKGSNLTALAATFTTTGSKVEIVGVEQINGVTTNNFSAPVVYKVTALNQSSMNYTVKVTATQTACLFISKTSAPISPEDTNLVKRLRTAGFLVNVDSAKNLPKITPNFHQFDFAFLSETPNSSAYAPLKGHPLPLLNLEAFACVKGLNYSTNAVVSNFDSLPIIISTKADASLLNGLTKGSEIKFINGYTSGVSEIGFIPTITNIPIAMFKDTTLIILKAPVDSAAVDSAVVDTPVVKRISVDSATYAKFKADGGLTAACAVDSGITLADGITITQNRAVTIGINATSYNFITQEAYKLIDAGIRWILREN